LSSLSFEVACRRDGAPAQQIDVKAGDVVYLGYSIHPHLSAWLKPSEKIAYTQVKDDAAFNLFKAGDPQKVTEALQCRWKDEIAASGPTECLLSKQTRYEFDLRAGTIASTPAATVQLAAGTARAFGGRFEIPSELTKDYQVYFDVHAEPRPEPDPPPAGYTPPDSPATPPAFLLRRLFRQDVSALCAAATGACTVDIAPVCDPARPQADCDAFFANPNMPYVLATRVTVLHKIAGASLPARNISARLSELTWRVPPYIRSIFTEKPDPNAPSGIVFTPTTPRDENMVLYLPVAMGEPDLEYVRVEQGTFANPDTKLDDGDPEPDQIDFADILSAERDNIALARIRQTLALCSFRTEILDFLRALFSSYGSPFADDYLNYWQSKIDSYNTRCAVAETRFKGKSFTKLSDGTEAKPAFSEPNALRLPFFLRDLPYAEQITSAETLLERVLANLALGEELLTDAPRLTRRGYRLPLKVNPLDCKALALGKPLTQPIVGPDAGDCAYRLSLNFAMQEFEEVIAAEVAKNLREILARFETSTKPAFTVHLTATVNGRPIGFRQLSGESTGNDPCAPTAPNTCLGQYGTRETALEPIELHFYPKRKTGPAGPHGDVFQRITVNKRSGRATAFTNNTMRKGGPTVCHRNFSDYQNLGEMEGKQDCRLEDAQKYTGQEAYEVSFVIGENNQFLGRNRVLEFRANPLDVLELHIYLAGVDQSVDRQSPNDQITGRFSVFDGAASPPVGINRDRYLIPRSPSQILSRSEQPKDSSVKQLGCPQVPKPPTFGPAALPPSCRPWTRLGWTEVLLGAQYRTYSDAQRVGDIADRFSILRRREVLRLHPEIEVAADQFVLDHEDLSSRPTLPTVGQVKGRFAFYTRGPNVTKTGGDWSLFAGKAQPDGTLREPIAFVAPPTVNAPADRSLRYGPQIFPPAPPTTRHPVKDASTACSVDTKPPHNTPPNHEDCQTHFGSRPEDNLSLKGIAYFPLLHQFVGPATKADFDKALRDEPARSETSVCGAEAPRLIAGCWKGADDTVFMENAVSPFAGSVPAVYSVSALAGFERPPIAQFLFQFDSYTKIACIDPESPGLFCSGYGYNDGSAKLPNRPIPPDASSTIEVFAPVQSSSSTSVSVNAGVAYVNVDYIHTVVNTIRQFRDVNGDGYADVIADGVVELTSPVGLSRRDWWTYFRATDNLPDLSSELTAGDADQSTTSHSEGAGIGLTASTAALFLSNGTKTNKNTGSPDPNVDPGFNFSLESGQDDQFIELRDFNGDGLADKLTKNTSDGGLTLQFNAGNSLRAGDSVSTSMLAGVPFNTSHSQGFGVRLGFSYGAGSFLGGLGLAHRDSGSQAALIDFTGDGRPDIVLPLDDGLMVFPNLGNGFGPGKIHKLKDWQQSPQATKNSGTGLLETSLLDAGVLFTFGIPLPFGLKIVFTPGVKWARNQTRELLQIRDLNGDGVPDVVAVSGTFLPSLSGGDPTLDPSSLRAQVHYNPEAKYHLLTGVTNPSGSKWVLQHGLFGNSGPEHGRAVWAVTGVARYDGYEPQQQPQPDLAPDGQDVLLTTYDYSHGYYDRAERQFYGFGKRTSTVYGCDLGKSGESCLNVLKDPVQLNWAALNPAGYRKLQVTAQTFANLDFLTQGVELSRTIAGANSFADDPGTAEPPLQAVSRTEFGYSIDDLQTLATPLDPQCEVLKFDRLADSWNANSFKIDGSGSALPATADGTQFDKLGDPPLRKQTVFGSNSICHADVKGCAAQLRRNACEAGFVHEQRAFWAQQTGSVRQRFISLETFGGDVPASEFSTPAVPTPPRLISAVAFDHDQWGQVLAFDSIGEADSQWNSSSESSVNAAIKYAPKQALNVDGSGKAVGYPLLGLAQEIQIFRGPWKDPDTVDIPLRVREAIYSGDNGQDKDKDKKKAVNLTDICLYPGGTGFRFVPEMCSAFKDNMRAALADGYSSMQTALRAAYENTDGLPKGESSFDAVIHHQIAEYDPFGNIIHTVSPLSYNKEWIERRFDYTKDPFRRTATLTKLTRCVNDIPGAGADTPSLDPKDKPQCTFGMRELPKAVLRKPITHAFTSRVDTHFGAVVETSDINDNKILHDLDRWGRLSLLARFWGNAPRENATFQSRLQRAVAKDESRPVKDSNGNDINLTPETMLEVKDWHILAVADYERISDGLLRSNLRRVDASDSYSGLLGKDQTIRETATFADGLGRSIQAIREADVCLGIADELIGAGKNKAPSADLAARCSGTASAIVTPATLIDALGRDLQSFESYAIPTADPRFPEGKVRESTARRFISLIPPSAKPFRPLVNTRYDGAGRPLRVESRLADSNPQPADPAKGTAQYNYRVVPEKGPRLARFEALTLSPRCTASAVWSDARGLKHTVFEDQTTFYPSTSALPLGNPPAPESYQRDYDKTRGFCAPIANIVGNWSEVADDTKLGGQPARVSYSYDPLQQPTGVDYPLDGTERRAIATRFDLLGRMLELQEPNSGCTAYAYDGLNSLIRETGYRYASLGKPCDSASKVRNEKAYEYSAGRLVRMSYHSLEEQGGAPDEGDTVRFYYDRSPSAVKFGQVLETLRFVPNDQANQRFVDVAGRKCDNCIGQAAVVTDRSGARSYSFNELGLARREVRSIVAPVTLIERGDSRSETYLPEIAFYEAENAYTAFGDPVQERFSEGVPMNPANACVTAGVNTCLSRFTVGRKYAPDGAVAQLLFNGKPLINAAQDALGRPAVLWTANGIATGYRYDSEDLRLNQMSTLTGAQQPVQVNGYQYDGGGNIVAYANNSSMLEQYTSAFVFKYDAVNRLTDFAAAVRKDEKKLTSEGAYTYDPGHRFKTRSLRIAGIPGKNFLRQWLYRYRSNPETGPLHAPRAVNFTVRLIGPDEQVSESTRRTSFDYDDVGRMTRICTNSADNEPRVCSVEKPDNDQRPELLSNRAMTWDAEGRLTRVRGVLDFSVPQNAELMREDYVYDAGGNRTLKIHRPPRTDNLPEGARESATIYMTPYYSRPYDRRGSVQVSLGALSAASMTVPADPSEEPRATFLYSDLPAGSMTAAVTAFGEPTQANATLIARREYSPYGLELTVDELAQTGRDGVAPMSVFHGKELDRRTNFSSFGARHYSRDLGIWLKPDPMLVNYLRGAPNKGVFQPANLSLYAFAASNPTLVTDPTGMCGSPTGEPQLCAAPDTWGTRHPILGKALGDQVALLNWKYWGTEISVNPITGVILTPKEQQTEKVMLVATVALLAVEALAVAGRTATETIARGGTYILRDAETGQVMRTGRTNDLLRREAEHARDIILKDFEFEPVHRTDIPAARRGLEQMLHDEFKPPLNKIRPIDPANPRFEEYMDAAKEFLK
jgi:RHS repeat-associated protein